jgi:uncharacterized protein (DUF2062 family)
MLGMAVFAAFVAIARHSFARGYAAGALTAFFYFGM